MKYVLILFCLINVSLAQATRQIQLKHVTNTLFSMGKSKLRNIEIKYREEDKWVEALNIRLEDQGFSPPINYQGNAEMGIFIEGTNQPFTKVRIPSGEKWIALFIATRDPKRPYKVYLIDDDSFQYGHYRLFNLSTVKIGVKIGMSRKLIHPNSSLLVDPEKNKGEKERFPVQFYTVKNSEVRRFSATQWSRLKNKRTMVFVYRDPRSKRYTYRGIDDYSISESQMAMFSNNEKLLPELKRIPKGKDGYPVNPVSLLSAEEIKILGEGRVELMNRSHILDLKRLKAMAESKRNLKPKRKPVVVRSSESFNGDEKPRYKK